MGSAEIAAGGGGVMVGVGSVSTVSVWVGVAGVAVLAAKFGVFVYVGKKGNGVLVSSVV
jgi:hypothetical protein